MGNEKELKPISFRISDEMRERLNALAKEEGWSNKEQTLNILISSYEMSQAKLSIGERKTEIETFETHINALLKVYLMSLQLNMDTEERIKASYEGTIGANQKEIQILLEKNDEFKRAIEVKDIIDKRNTQLEKEIERTQAEMKKTETLCHEYKEKNDTLNGLLVEYRGYRDENKTLSGKQKDLEGRQAELEATIKKMEIESENVRKQMEAELENTKKKAESDLKLSILELKEEHQEKMGQIKTSHHDEMEKATAEYRDNLREMESLRKENYEMRQQLFQLQVPEGKNKIDRGK